MTTVVLKRSNAGNFVSFKAKGHADYAEHGSDIVCAGVSALLQSAALSIVNYVGAEAELDVGDGNLSLVVSHCSTPQIARDCEVVFNTVLIGLREIEKQFPQHLRVTELD